MGRPCVEICGRVGVVVSYSIEYDENGASMPTISELKSLLPPLEEFSLPTWGRENSLPKFKRMHTALKAGPITCQMLAKQCKVGENVAISFLGAGMAYGLIQRDVVRLRYASYGSARTRTEAFYRLRRCRTVLKQKS